MRIARSMLLALALALAVGAAPPGLPRDGGNEGGGATRFERVGEGVRDRQLGVVWAARDNGVELDWPQAQAYCAGLGKGWTLPGIAQLEALFDPAGEYDETAPQQASIEPATDLITFSGRMFWSSEAEGPTWTWAVWLGGGRSRGMASGAVARALCLRPG